MDQEQVENVTSISGDLLKVFQHQSIPGIDEVFAYRRTERAYKLISSAAYNWDKGLVMSETYGGISNMPVSLLYRMGMDLYAKGINLMVPHAVWTDAKHIVFPPELSWRDATYGPALPEYNRWIGRLNLMLQGGRHVADIGVLYPVATLQAGTQFDVGKPYDGGPTVPEADYMRIGELLSLGRAPRFHLPASGGAGSTLLRRGPDPAPKEHGSSRTISRPDPARRCDGLRQQPGEARKFFDAGGAVIATTQLPLRRPSSARTSRSGGTLSTSSESNRR